MANGHPSVRALAGRVAPAHDEDGVAQVLEELFGLGT
jgi:hydroxymethylpyrimidine pyrophosphatase-like HAD family hydrolase